MKDIPNGTYLGDSWNSENTPCKKIADQRYIIKVIIEGSVNDLGTHLKEERITLSSLGLEVNGIVQVLAQREYQSPLECLKAANKVIRKGFSVGIEERRFGYANEETWGKISGQDLEKIMKGDRSPAYRLEPKEPDSNKEEVPF